MKYAIISDIHGNLPALKAVLDDAGEKGIKNYIVAGDYCLSGPFPNECISILRQLDNAYIIRGNEEQYLENLNGVDQVNWTDGQMQISYWCYRNISKENLDYLFNLPHAIDFKCNGLGIHIAHSEKAFIEESRLGEKTGPAMLAMEFGDKSITGERLKEYVDTSIKNCPDFEIVLKNLEAGVYIFGHTHVQWDYEDNEKNILLINPGSCGLPLDGITDSVPYSILDVSNDGNTKVEKCRIPFDTGRYIETLKRTSQYNEANVWSKVIIKELMSAKEHLTFFLRFVNKYAEKINDKKRPFSIDTWEKAFELWENTLND